MKRQLHRQVDASVEASRPHDFTVRGVATRQLATPYPSHPASNVRDDRDTPSYQARDGRASKSDLPDGTSGILGDAHQPRRLRKRETRPDMAYVALGPKTDMAHLLVLAVTKTRSIDLMLFQSARLRSGDVPPEA